MLISAATATRILSAFKAHYNRPLVNAPAAFFKQIFFHLFTFYMNFAHKYVIFMKGDTLDDVVEEGLHQVYVFLMRALQEHRRQGRNGDYESFAIELLALLQKYRPLYTTPMLEPPESAIRS